MFPDCDVIGVHIVMKFVRRGREKFDLIALKEEYLRLEKRIEHWRSNDGHARKVESARARKAEIEETLGKALRTTPKCTGYAFITMGSPAQAARLQEAFTRRNKEQHVTGDLVTNHQRATIVKLSKHGKMRGSMPIGANETNNQSPSLPASQSRAHGDGGEQAKAKKRALAYHLRARYWTVSGAPERGDIVSGEIGDID